MKTAIPYLAVLVLLLAGISLCMRMVPAGPIGPVLGAEVEGDCVTLTWWPAKPAVIFEVQVSLLRSSWVTVAATREMMAKFELPDRASQFRVRGWTSAGPGAWSRPTEWLFYEVEDENVGLRL